ncbi:MAG: Zn-ribbon domain-containing OB-fold protein [Anaerolineae bacterium]|nr:Zn-ribbon domain-containing OB-fold protein [Anaerolineae bacterium]
MAENLATHWRLRAQRYQLVGSVCSKCAAKYFPPRQVCPKCRGTEFEPLRFSGNGELYSFTTLRSAPAGFESYTPYSVGMVKLDEGPLVEAMLTDVNEDELAIGMRMEMVTRKIREEDGERGLLIYGYKFRPAQSRAP